MEAFHKENSQREFHQRFQSQSATEYLMTYGWAILIIAVVLAALFELGVFNPMTFAPKASPGSCQVVRPEGAGTTNFISLEGECNGELPQYVASFTPIGPWIYSSTSPLPNGTSSATITAWINPKIIQGDGSYAGIVGIDGNNGGASGLLLSLQGSTGRPSMATWSNDYVPSSGLVVTYNTWDFVAVTVSGITATLYVNSQSESGTLFSDTDMNLKSGGYSENFRIGSTDSPGRQFNGSIANVQVYNTALSSNDIKALYQEGIGGAPIDLQSLVGWWPLNGNANDYSGNGNNGVPSGVTYTSNWYSGYSAP